MPKNRTRTKNENGAWVVSRPCSKLRIGTRKSGKSALIMSNDELIAVLDDANKKRYHHKARTVLLNRGVKLNWPEGLTEDHSLQSLADEMRGNTAN